jgi:hypothetical protein
MNHVESNYRRQQYERMLNTFVECLGFQKRHYMLVYLILTSLRCPDDPLPPYWESVLVNVPAAPSHAPYPPIERIFQKLTRCKGQDVMDALTFGGIPPYFSFFLTDFGISAFLDLLNLYADNPAIYDGYARMAFASPLFITFACEVFQPILSSLLPDRPLPVFELFANKIRERWGRSLPTMAPVVTQLLQRAPDPQRTLSEAFFEVALDSERARIFGLVDYSQTLRPDLVVLLRILLKFDSKHHILGELVEMTTSGVPCKFTIFKEEDRDTVPALFQPVLLSTFDFNTWAAVQLPGSQFVHPSVYEARAYLHTGEEETFCLHNAIEATMTVDHLRVEAALRHLLQDADPIPLFKRVPDGLTIRDFFRQYLLRRGPRETLTRRYDNLMAIEWKSVVFSDEKKLRGALAGAPLERRKEIRALSAFTRLWETFAQTNKETQSARDSIQQLFYSYPVFRWCDKFAPSPLPPYVRNPALLIPDFFKLKDRWTAEPLFTAPQPLISEIIYAYLTRTLSFDVFVKSKPDLEAMDRELYDCFKRKSETLCNELFPVTATVPGHWNKNKWLRERLELMKSRPEFFDRLRFAAVESAPFHKLQEFGKAFRLIRRYVAENFPPSKDLGEDELLPVQIASVILANPPGLASNLGFICEFCGSPRYERLFHQLLVQPLSVLRMVCKYLRNVQPLIDLGYVSTADLA